MEKMKMKFSWKTNTRQEHMSEETAKKVDMEVKKIVDAGYQRAKKFLLKN